MPKDFERNMFNPLVKGNIQGRNIPRSAYLQNQTYLVSEGLNM